MTRDEMIEAGARALAALSCRCGHRQDQHDPEDGDCESARGFVKCPCRAFRTSDPNETTAEYRAAAVVDAIHPDEYEQVGEDAEVGRLMAGAPDDLSPESTLAIEAVLRETYRRLVEAERVEREPAPQADPDHTPPEVFHADLRGGFAEGADR